MHTILATQQKVKHCKILKSQVSILKDCHTVWLPASVFLKNLFKSKELGFQQQLLCFFCIRNIHLVVDGETIGTTGDLYSICARIVCEHTYVVIIIMLPVITLKHPFSWNILTSIFLEYSSREILYLASFSARLVFSSISSIFCHTIHILFMVQ